MLEFACALDSAQVWIGCGLRAAQISAFGHIGEQANGSLLKTSDEVFVGRFRFSTKVLQAPAIDAGGIVCVVGSPRLACRQCCGDLSRALKIKVEIFRANRISSSERDLLPTHSCVAETRLSWVMKSNCRARIPKSRFRSVLESLSVLYEEFPLPAGGRRRREGMKISMRFRVSNQR